MKAWIDCTEEYPVYWINEERLYESDPEINLTDEELADYRAMRAHYDRWQDRLSEEYPEDDRHWAERPTT